MKKGFMLLVALAFHTTLLAAAPPSAAPLKIIVPTEGTLALAVLDSRPDVVSGERQETFVGLSRSLYGIPYPAHTQSRKPFAQELGNTIVRALKLGDTKSEHVFVSPYKGRSGATDALKATGASRLLLLEIKDWWSDKLVHTDLHYDLVLSVLDSKGGELGSSSAIGHDELGKRQRPERRDLLTATKDILASLFSAQSIVAGFSPDAIAVPPTERTCTVEQILKMKDAGLTQDQIQAVCGSKG